MIPLVGHTIKWYSSLIDHGYQIASEIFEVEKGSIIGAKKRNGKDLWDAQRVIHAYMHKEVGISYENQGRIIGLSGKTLTNRTRDYEILFDSDAQFRNRAKAFGIQMDKAIDMRLNLLHEINELRSEMHLKLNELQDRMTP